MRWLLLALMLASPARAERSSSADVATAVVLGAAAAGLVAYDVYLATSGARTESMVVRDAAWKANVLPYLGGALAAHLFITRENPSNLWMVGLATVPIVVTYDLLAHDAGRAWWRHPGIAFGAGLA